MIECKEKGRIKSSEFLNLRTFYSSKNSHQSIPMRQ